MASPLIGGQDILQAGMTDALVGFQYLFYQARYVQKADAPAKKVLYCDLVRGAEDSRIGATPPPRLQGQPQTGVAALIQRLEMQSAQGSGV